MCIHFDSTRFLRRGYAVLQRILDERLKDEIRHERVARSIVDAQRDLEPSLKTNLHDVEVPLQQLQLSLERHLLFRRLLQRVTKELAQPSDHPANAFRIAIDEARDGVKRVEQEMRVELRSQHGELGFRQTRLELGGFGAEEPSFVDARLIAKEVMPRHTGAEDGQIHQQVVQELESDE